MTRDLIVRSWHPPYFVCESPFCASLNRWPMVLCPPRLPKTSSASSGIEKFLAALLPPSRPGPTFPSSSSSPAATIPTSPVKLLLPHCATSPSSSVPPPMRHSAQRRAVAVRGRLRQYQIRDQIQEIQRNQQEREMLLDSECAARTEAECATA